MHRAVFLLTPPMEVMDLGVMNFRFAGLALLMVGGCFCGNTHTPLIVEDGGASDAGPDSIALDSGPDAQDAGSEQAWVPVDGPDGGFLRMLAVGEHIYGWTSSAVVFHTEDGGRHWDRFPFVDWGVQSFTDAVMGGVAEMGGGRALLGTLTGLHETRDEGRHWAPLETNLPEGGVSLVRRVGSTTYAVVQPPSLARNTLCASEDGLVWRELLTVPTGIAGYHVSPTWILVKPINEEQIWRSTDGGESWRYFTAPRTILVPTSFVVTTNGIVMSPARSGESVYLSVDGGMTWAPDDTQEQFAYVTEHDGSTYAFGERGLVTLTDATGAWRDVDSDIPGVGEYGLVSTPSALLGTTREWGVARVDSDQVRWAAPPAAWLEHFVSDGTQIWGASSSGRLTYHLADGATTWDAYVGPVRDGERIVAFAQEAGALYEVVRTHPAEIPRLHRSDDNGANWTRLGRPLLPLIPRQQGDVTDLSVAGEGVLLAFEGGVSSSPSISHALYGGLYVSTDGGDTFLPAPLPLQPDPESVMPVAPDVLAAVFVRDGVALASSSIWSRENVAERYDAGDNTLYRSTDGGMSWNPVAVLGNRARDSHIHHLVVAQGQVFALSKRAVFRSTDEGQNWAQLPLTGMTGEPYDVTVLPSAIVVSTRSGVFVSEDDGATTYSLPEGLPSAASGLEVSGEDLYAATGAGVWRW